MNSSYGIANLWLGGDWITRSVALFLLAMSIASWVVIVTKSIALWSLRRQARAAERFWHGTNFEEALPLLGADNNAPWRMLAIEGREAVRHQRRSQQQLHDALDLSDWVSRILRNTLDAIAVRMSSGLAVLASVGSTAPFVGLFGTVWGIYHALMAIAISGQTSIDRVAGPIGEALIMTAFGLAVAIPAVLGYNALVRANKALLGQLRHFAHDLHAYLLTGARLATPDEVGKVVSINQI